ncbi:ABC transporter ATP-binding protein [Hyphomicrobium facile]|uniref:Spermidine/putrescine transport system ATP-binding protein n=1 Tax=Hyphomicrobium facile TaxID=51670 RepID=A0A1I7NK21_9HYPH|nr:ABC transporter ATP-binding protein [Hyphomicrobium facile]SFV35003.1 spermidine/putrescine transport system ATP-binding protein [Hyphomicrobium facile]
MLSASEHTPLLRLTGISKSFGTQVALHPLDLSVARGDFVALLGPSGCGKTTLLRVIGGFLRSDQGRVEINGADVTDLGPEQRPTNMVFQGYGLFPHMTVRENVAYGLKIARVPAEKRNQAVGEILEMMHISGLSDRLPRALSGGQQQRVALARALVMKPSVLLLDEPLAALDLQLRKSMQIELRNLHREIGGTFICVTHDQGEAIGLANRVAVMNAGRIVQEGTPEDIYQRPSNAFVAGFVGESNILSLTRQSGSCRLADNIIPSSGPDGTVAMMIRPDDISLVEVKPAAEISLYGQLTDAVFMGDHVKLIVAAETGDTLTVHRSRQEWQSDPLESGKRVFASWSRDACHILEQS